MFESLDNLSNSTIKLVNAVHITCRCCGKNLGLERFMDDAPIHTRCIPKHWGKHSKEINASRCKEFKS